MMRLRRALVIAWLFLLASAPTALAECAWVLWQFDGLQWTMLTASHQRTECDRERVGSYGLGDKTPQPGVGTLTKGKDGKNFFTRYDCLPDTVIREGRKGSDGDEKLA